MIATVTIKDYDFENEIWVRTVLYVSLRQAEAYLFSSPKLQSLKDELISDGWDIEDVNSEKVKFFKSVKSMKNEFDNIGINIKNIYKKVA